MNPTPEQLEAWMHDKLCYLSRECKTVTAQSRLRTLAVDYEMFKAMFKGLTGRDFLDKEVA